MIGRWGRQGQRAGSNAQQIQVSGDLVVSTGVTEARAKEIALEAARSVIADFSDEAKVIGANRIGHFDQRLVSDFAADGHLSAFADPAFHVSLRQAQLGAASTERLSDVDMLVGLLAQRVTKGHDRIMRAGLTRAVQIVDQVDEDALAGLTAFVSVEQWGPSGGGLHDGLDTMERLYSELIADELPGGEDWLNHLDLLDAVRVNRMAPLKSFDDYYPHSHFPNYVSRGIEAGSSIEQTVSAKLKELGFHLSLVEHELKPGFRRVDVPTIKQVRVALTDAGCPSGLSESIEAVLKRDLAVDEIEASLLPLVVEEISNRPRLAKLRLWWNGIPYAFTVTAVGRALAIANVKRLNVSGSLPSFE